jgi:hypothetical protein
VNGAERRTERERKCEGGRDTCLASCTIVFIGLLVFVADVPLHGDTVR